MWFTCDFCGTEAKDQTARLDPWSILVASVGPLSMCSVLISIAPLLWLVCSLDFSSTSDGNPWLLPIIDFLNFLPNLSSSPLTRGSIHYTIAMGFKFFHSSTHNFCTLI